MYKFHLKHITPEGASTELDGIFPNAATAVGWLHDTFGLGKTTVISWDRWLVSPSRRLSTSFPVRMLPVPSPPEKLLEFHPLDRKGDILKPGAIVKTTYPGLDPTELFILKSITEDRILVFDSLANSVSFRVAPPDIPMVGVTYAHLEIQATAEDPC